MLAYVSIPTGELSKIQSRHLHVLQGLMTFCDREGKCWPSLRRLADVCGMTLSKVQRIIGEMSSLGYVDITRRVRGSQIYRLANRFVEATKKRSENRTLAKPAESLPKTKTVHRDTPCLSPTGGTEVRKITNIDSSRSSEPERCAPEEEDASYVSTLVGTVMGKLGRRRRPEKSPQTKAAIRHLLFQKMQRYLLACGRPGELGAFLAVMADGADTDLNMTSAAKRAFDAVDGRMKAEKWDDHGGDR